jgi:AcrR family transcriptional regulator
VRQCKGRVGRLRRGASGPGSRRSLEVQGYRPVAERTDPRISRTTQACETAIVELASEKPISQISVADLAERAQVTRATFYNHYASPLELLIQVLLADLERADRNDEERRSRGEISSPELQRISLGEVADHIERFRAVYHHAVHDPADGGVYDALVRYFGDYATWFIARCSHPDLPTTNHHVIAEFLAHGFAGAIKAWLSDDSLTKEDLIDAAVACTPAWWS